MNKAVADSERREKLNAAAGPGWRSFEHSCKQMSGARRLVDG